MSGGGGSGSDGGGDMQVSGAEAAYSTEKGIDIGTNKMPIFLFGFSMGGLIATDLTIRFSPSIVTFPLFEILSFDLPKFSILRLVVPFGPIKTETRSSGIFM